MISIEKALKDYLDYLEIEKNRSPKTRENYERYLRAFMNYSKIKKPKEITIEKIKDFRVSLARKENLKKLIRNDYEVLSPDKIELPKIPKREIEIIEYNDLERFLSAPAQNTLRGLRDRAILETFFSTGLRISELCNLDRYLNLNRGEITVRGKGEKLRVVFLSDRAK